MSNKCSFSHILINWYDFLTYLRYFFYFKSNNLILEYKNHLQYQLPIANNNAMWHQFNEHLHTIHIWKEFKHQTTTVWGVKLICMLECICIKYLTWSWCSMPMLMVFMRIAIMMPLLKYLLSTMPQSFFLIFVQRALQCPKHVLLFFLFPSSLSSKWSSSLSVSFTASPSLSSPLAEFPTVLTPSFKDNAQTGQSSGFSGTGRLMELVCVCELWPLLLWCGHLIAAGATAIET